MQISVRLCGEANAARLTAVVLCPCVSPGVWLFSQLPPRSRRPQTDDSLFPSSPLVFSSFALHNAHSSLSRPSLSSLFEVSASDVLSAPGDVKKDARLLYICTLKLHFVYLLHFLSDTSMYKLTCFVGRLSVSLLNSDSPMTHLPVS